MEDKIANPAECVESHFATDVLDKIGVMAIAVQWANEAIQVACETESRVRAKTVECRADYPIRLAEARKAAGLS